MPPTPRSLPVVTFEHAKQHLRVTDDDHDQEIQDYLDLAVDRVFTKLNSNGCWKVDWIDEATTPLVIQAAVLKQLGGFYEHRGDDSSASDNHETALAAELDRLLTYFYKPSLA